MTEIDLSSPEVKQAIADAVAAEVSGLKAKNAELIEANKKLRKGQEIDPAELERVEAERDDFKAKLTEAQKLAKKAAADAEAATKRAADIDNAYSNTLRDSALADALAKAGVTNPVHAKAAKALLRDAATVVDENGVRTVKAGDKALGDFITEWAGSDEGKHFVAAPDTNGSGSHGKPPKHTAASSVTRQAFEAMTPAAQMAHIQANGAVTDA